MVLRKIRKISQPCHNGSEGVEHARGPEFNSRAFFNRVACKKLFFRGGGMVLGIVEKFIFREKMGGPLTFFQKIGGTQQSPKFSAEAVRGDQ